MIILIDSSQGTITVLADNGFPWKFSEKDPYVAKWYASSHVSRWFGRPNIMNIIHHKFKLFQKVALILVQSNI